MIISTSLSVREASLLGLGTIASTSSFTYA